MSCTCPLQPCAPIEIFKNECALCFREPKLLELCLQCWEAFCPADLPAHAAKHPNHCQFLCIAEEPEAEENCSLPKQPRLDPSTTKIVIPAAEQEKERKKVFSYKCTKCPATIDDFSALPAELAERCKFAIESQDASMKKIAAGDAWTEASAQVCEHSLCLEQQVITNNLSRCSECELDSNLWMCLTCGALGCGRRQFDGSGGNGHALFHFQSTGHPVAIKLGTILYRGPSQPLEADLYCYACDDACLDPQLSEHLRGLGIDPSTTAKTEKSTSELQLHLNLTHTYSMLDSSGTALPSIEGPGRRGLMNLGNSCYVASVLQVLRRIGELERIVEGHEYARCQGALASKCLLCQLKKLHTSIENSSTEEKFVIKPTLLKALLTAGHAEFSSSRQQDASEFLSFLLDRPPFSAVRGFAFKLGQTIKCPGCLKESSSCQLQNSLQLPCAQDSSRTGLLEKFFASEAVQRTCDQCGCREAQKTVQLASLPQYLCVVVNRLQIRNWIPEKVDCCVQGMDADLQLNSVAWQENQIAVNEEMLGELLMMGIEEEPARAALIACQNSSLQAAMDNLFNCSADGTDVVDEGAVEMGVAAGFEREAVMEALKATNGDLESAMNHLLSTGVSGSNGHASDALAHASNTNALASNAHASTANADTPSTATYRLQAFITHQGSSMHCGHYVAHLRSDDGWELYNDEKVALAKEGDASFPVEKAYIYIYIRD